jgi:uncharacterized SAM-binding protein YcdF (DUF218 family)
VGGGEPFLIAAKARNQSKKTWRAGKKSRSRRQPAHHGHWKLRLVALCTAFIVIAIAWTAIERLRAPGANAALEHFDALIVLGYPADRDGNPTPTQLARVTEAVHEYERGTAPRIIMTGAAVANGFVEAQVMAKTAVAQGIPASAIVVEPVARDTIQNACYSVRIMRSHGWRSAEVISSPSHLTRAALIFGGLPISWSVHAAPALEPASSVRSAAEAAIEFIKTARYLLWTRQTEPCQL